MSLDFSPIRGCRICNTPLIPKGESPKGFPIVFVAHAIPISKAAQEGAVWTHFFHARCFSDETKICPRDCLALKRIAILYLSAAGMPGCGGDENWHRLVEFATVLPFIKEDGEEEDGKSEVEGSSHLRAPCDNTKAEHLKPNA